MQTINTVIGAAALGLFVGADGVRADIIQSDTTSSPQLSALSPMGQSFTAVDGLVDTISFGIAAVNPAFSVADLTVNLFGGAGFGGSLLATKTASGGEGWIDFVLNTPVSLTVGNVYTAQISTTTARWGLNIAGDVYAGGSLWVLGSEQSGSDAQFRVLAAEPVVVPAPSAALLGMVGLGMVSRFVRRFA